MNTNKSHFAKATLWLVILCALFLGGTTQAWATSYYVWGQVFQVTEEDADDTDIPDTELIGDPRPYVTVKLFDLDTDEFLGQATSDQDGIFTIQYDKPTGTILDVYQRVYQETINATDEELLPAREEINTFRDIGQYFGSGLRVVTDEFVTYGDDGLTTDAGVGIVFTRVGKVEIPFISQDISNSLVGLADYTNDTAVPPRHQELHLRPFKEAPFARGLLVFGEFGLPGGACDGDQIDYYQVYIQKYEPESESDPDPWGPAQLWTQPMRKMRTAVTTVPMVSVNHELVPVGPFTGTDSTPTSIEGLYWVNRNELGGPTNYFYSFPDLRVNWRTHNWMGGAHNGIYKITMDYYRHVSGPREAPEVERLEDDPDLSNCFIGTPSSGVSDGLHQLLLHVNNQAMTVKFDHIYLKHFNTGNYFPKTGSTDVTDPEDALDFNAEGLCDIMELQNKYDIEVLFTAHHAGNFMRYYRLTATPNMGSTVTFVDKSYPPPPPPYITPPFWEGTPAGGLAVSASKDDFTKCGYIFTLSASSRLQNGYNHVQWRHPQRAFYIVP